MDWEIYNLAKRFFDTRLLKKKWFRDAPLHIQLAYIFLLSECDIAGIWDIDLEVLSIYAKASITLSEIIQYLNAGKERVRVLDSESKLWLIDFVTFQYGLLTSASPPHRPVLKRLLELGLPLPLKLPSVTLQEKEEEKDKYKDQEEEKEKRKAHLQKMIAEFKEKFPESPETAQ